jgi:hypothetical protein
MNKSATISKGETVNLAGKAVANGEESSGFIPGGDSERGF